MDTFQALMNGFTIALTPQNLLFALIGSVLGTMVGVLPGVGPVAGTAMLIPLTFQLPPISAIIMLSAIYYGSQYGGTITSVLLNVPGEASTAVTCLDGYQMAKQGRAGVALSIAAIGSFIGGTFAVMILVVAAPPLARTAIRFGPPEIFGLMMVGLVLVIGLASKSMVKALMMGFFGLLLSMIGMDPAMGMPRYTFGSEELLDGLDFVPVIMGLFGLGEILVNAENPVMRVYSSKIANLIPTRQDVRDSVGPILRGSAIGVFVGLIPGMLGSVSSFSAYIVETRLSKHPERFGTGVIEGVAAPETANNAHANGALIPLFTLGIPGSPTVAVLMGAFMMNGLIPGPFLFKEHPDFVWAVIASLYVGNVMLLILNLPLVGVWVSVLKIPYSILFALISCFMLIGAYSMDGRPFPILIMILFGVLGYVLKKLDFPLAPVILTLILGPIMERALRGTLEMSEGDITLLFTRPAAAVLLVVAFLLLLSFAVGFRSLPSSFKDVRGDAEV